MFLLAEGLLIKIVSVVLFVVIGVAMSILLCLIPYYFLLKRIVSDYSEQTDSDKHDGVD